MKGEELKQLIKEEIASRKLTSLISQAIDQVNPDLSYKDFAKAVALILREEYGQHNFNLFIKELNKELNL
jgi:hypothetical protein